ncbi:MAG: hypothetical protein V2A62_02195 [Candidatus Woesearchaeota archaeon]
MVQKRWKRKSGYVTPQPTIPFKEIIKEGFFVNRVYDDWSDWRDGARDWYHDFKLIKRIHNKRNVYFSELVNKRIQMNRKQKRLIQRRKARGLFLSRTL